MSSKIQLMDYDPQWPEVFMRELTESGPCLGAKPCKSSILGQPRCQALPPNPSSTSFLLLPTRPTNLRMCRSWNLLATRCTYGNPTRTSTACLKGLLRTSTYTFFPLLSGNQSHSKFPRLVAQQCRGSRFLRTNQTGLGRKRVGGCPGLRRCQDRGH